MNSLKQVIVNAIHKVSVDPAYSGKHYETPEDARADFVKSLIAELFPESPAAPESTYAEPKVEKKKRAPKAKKEAEIKVEVPVVAEVKPEVKAEEVKPEEPKKKRAPKAKKVEEAVAEVTTDSKHEEPVAEVKTEAKPEEPKEKKKRAPKKEKTEEEKKPKIKEEKPKHVEKLSPTDTKKLKAIAEEAKQEFDKKAVLAYLNGLEKETLDSKTLEEHAREFYAPKVAMIDKELLVVEFKGEEYCVDTDTTPMKVYKSEGEVDKLVGHVGALEFTDMVIPSGF